MEDCAATETGRFDVKQSWRSRRTGMEPHFHNEQQTLDDLQCGEGSAFNPYGEQWGHAQQQLYSSTGRVQRVLCDLY
jgi:hypothetical protein